jgi:hypothetical protein
LREKSEKTKVGLAEDRTPENVSSFNFGVSILDFNLQCRPTSKIVQFPARAPIIPQANTKIANRAELDKITKMKQSDDHDDDEKHNDIAHCMKEANLYVTNVVANTSTTW